MSPEKAAMRFTVTIEPEFEPMIPRFMENRSKELAAMQAALTRQDFESIRRLAHGLKGAGGSYGFDGLSTLGNEVEQAAKAADETGVASGLSSIAAYLTGVEVTFGTYDR
ncbi:MAG: Hpt domain-containing protein [Nitrospiraceae bacterium]|nr:Hpt domain-containing protein [Nitrospiraceae bacterium]